MTNIGIINLFLYIMYKNKYKTKYLKLYNLLGGARLNDKNLGKLVLLNSNIGILSKNAEGIFQVNYFNDMPVLDIDEDLSEDMFKVINTTEDYLLLIPYIDSILTYISMLEPDSIGIFTSKKLMNIYISKLKQLQSTLETETAKNMNSPIF